jgi:hypothetical protein
MTTSDPSLGDERDPPCLNNELPLPESNIVDDPGIPPALPLDIILYSVSSIWPWMIGEMGLFHDIPISLFLVLLVPGSFPAIHLHFIAGFWAWNRGLFIDSA